MPGVRVRTWEHEPSVYERRGDRVVHVSGRDLGPVDLGVGDADAIGIPPGVYQVSDGPVFLQVLWITFRGTRMWAERF